jgi:hypothetical protein
LPACWNPDGEKSDRAEEERSHGKCDRTPRFDAEEEAGHEGSKPECSAESQSHANTGKHYALADDHVAEVRSLGAERHAHTEFLGALLDGVGHDAIDADSGHQKSCGSENDDEEHIEALACGVTRFFCLPS